MKKSTIVRKLIVSVFCVLLLCGCGGSKNKLVGDWRADDPYSAYWDYLYFYSDGTYSSSDSNYKGTYSVDGSRLRMEGFLVDDVNAQFKVQGDKLTLDYWARTSVYTRIKE